MPRIGRKPYSLLEQNSVFYTKLWNFETGTYSTRRSTGMNTRDEDVGVVTHWLHDGIPESDGIKPAKSMLSRDTLIAAIHESTFGDRDAQMVLTAFKDQGFIENAFTKSSPSAEPLTDFLRRAWRIDGPYVAERRAY